MIVDPDFFHHWKTRVLKSLLNEKHAAIYVLQLWSHCHNRMTDRFENLPAKALKAICEFDGDEKDLEAALTEAGFIKRIHSRTSDAIPVLEVIGWRERNKGLFTSAENGKKGGRPRKPVGDELGGAGEIENLPETNRLPAENLQDTDRLPTGIPLVPHSQPAQNRVERSGEEKSREELKTKKEKEGEVKFAFNSPAFKSAWDRWERHRIQQHKPIGDVEAEQQQIKLARFTEDEAIQVIEFSIEVGAKNLITNGDHRKEPPSNGKKKPFWE